MTRVGLYKKIKRLGIGRVGGLIPYSILVSLLVFD